MESRHEEPDEIIEPAGTIFTIGYGGRTREQFLEPLLSEGVEVVADVRLNPNRSSMGMYVKAKSADKGIEKVLASQGITYEWFEELGNPVPREPGMIQFRELIARSGSELTGRLVEMATRKRTCLLCAEKNPTACHRSVVGEYLASRGWRVIHL